MLLPALANAAQRARTTKCGSNLRQLGVALNLYTQDANCFPLATQNGVTGAWQVSLQSVTPALPLHCPVLVVPTANFVQIFNWTGGPVYPHYGYNALGAVYQGSPPYNPGLGGDVNLANGSRTATSVNRVVNPAQMISLGDSSLFLDVMFGTQPATNIPNQIYIAFPYKIQSINNTGVGDWHGKGANFVFGDGHIQFAPQSVWIAASDASRRLWNSDNQPHPEWW